MSQPNDTGSLATSDVGLFETGNFADATIVCGDRTWKVHKVILSSRCKWFERAFFGKMAEAASGRIVLEEQDPNLIDIMLRFIYSRDIEIPKLGNGKDFPAICVKLFRVADFFLLKELQSNVMTGLDVYLDGRITIPNNGGVSNARARELEVSEVLDAICEAYQDDSTNILRPMLLKFLWKRNDRMLKLPGIPDLLEKIPELGKDLIMFYISGDAAINMHDANTPHKGIRVLQAIRKPDLVYRASDQEVGAQGGAKVQCLLRYNPTYPPHFEPVNAETGAVIHELDWIAPSVSELTCNEASDIVCVDENSYESHKRLWLRFETPGDARYYIVCQGMSRLNNLFQSRETKEYLEKGMNRIDKKVSQAASS